MTALVQLQLDSLTQRQATALDRGLFLVLANIVEVDIGGTLHHDIGDYHIARVVTLSQAAAVAYVLTVDIPHLLRQLPSYSQYRTGELDSLWYTALYALVADFYDVLPLSVDTNEELLAYLRSITANPHLRF